MSARNVSILKNTESTYVLYTFGSITLLPWSVNFGHTVLIDPTPSQPMHVDCVPSCPPISSCIESAKTQNHTRPTNVYFNQKKPDDSAIITAIFNMNYSLSTCTSRYFHLERRLISGLSAQWVEPIKSPISKHFVVTQRSN